MSTASTQRSSVESRNAPNRVAMPRWRATTPSTRSKKPLARIRSPAARGEPTAKATAAAVETSAPITVSALGSSSHRNRNGNSRRIESSRSFPLALITRSRSRFGRGGLAVRGGFLGGLGAERGRLLRHVGQILERARALRRAHPAAPADQPAVEAHLLE